MLTETDIKYLAGLLDADGSFFFNLSGGYAQLTISLDLTTGVDKQMAFTHWFCAEMQTKPHIIKRDTNADGVESIKIIISRKASIETLVPRLLKYLVIKGAHLNRLYDKWVELRGCKLPPEAISELKVFTKESRLMAGPVKAREWLPKAYVAGFLDGDGSYTMKASSGAYNVNTVSHLNDRCVADLLFKQYGGHIYYQEDWIRWRHPLGRSNKSFAIPFLRDMVRHSRLKKWKIEQFLNYHSQRLSVETPTGEAIV